MNHPLPASLLLVDDDPAQIQVLGRVLAGGELDLAALPVIALTVIALTAGALASERQRAFDAGMDDFLSKPFDVDALIRCLRRHVERSRGGPLPVAARETAVPDMLPVEWPRIAGIDAADAHRRFYGDAALFTRLLHGLLEEFRDLAQPEDRPPADSAARDALAARLHKLRGGAGTLGARGVREHAGEAEAAVRQGREGPARRALHALADALASLIEAAGSLEPTLSPAPAPRDDAAPVPLHGARVEELLALLRQPDLGALPAFDHLAPALRAELAADRYASLQAALRQLRFGEAVEILAALGRNGTALETTA